MDSAHHDIHTQRDMFRVQHYNILKFNRTGMIHPNPQVITRDHIQTIKSLNIWNIDDKIEF